MARAVVKPNSDVYVGMIATICGAMLVGIGCAALELMEYDSGKPPASGLPTPDKLRADMKPLDEGSGSIKYGLSPRPADATRVTAAPTPPAETPAVAPPAMLPQLPVAANPPAVAPSGPTPSPLALPPSVAPSVPAASPPVGGPTPSPLNAPRSPRI